MYPNLYDISWKVDEPTYRADSALSQSNISKFVREGFDKLETLFDKVETPSLVFGSAVDAIITGGQEEFDKQFMVAEFPSISDNLQTIAKILFDRYSDTYRSISDIDDEILAKVGEECNYYAGDKYKKTRVKKIKEECQEYYTIMYSAKGKKIINTETYDKVCQCVKALRTSPATSKYFGDDTDDFQHFYQLKFKMPIDDFEVRGMLDLVIVDHINKTIYPIDLKTSSTPEWEFFRSFIKWRYDIQARLYWKILRYNLDQHPEFKDYEVADFTFIVVNKETLTPLTWLFSDSKLDGTLKYGKLSQVKLEDPMLIVRQLHRYLTKAPVVPDDIYIEVRNSIGYWLNQEML